MLADADHVKFVVACLETEESDPARDESVFSSALALSIMSQRNHGGHVRIGAHKP